MNVRVMLQTTVSNCVITIRDPTRVNVALVAANNIMHLCKINVNIDFHVPDVMSFPKIYSLTNFERKHANDPYYAWNQYYIFWSLCDN